MTASARGLFRATGRKSRPVKQRDLSGEIVEVEHREREEADFYPTPPEPTRAFLRAEASRLRDFPMIWEPAAGDGAMVREIKAAGHGCIGTDLVQRGGSDAIMDFFDAKMPPIGARAIITNPRPTTSSTTVTAAAAGSRTPWRRSASNTWRFCSRGAGRAPAASAASGRSGRRPAST